MTLRDVYRCAIDPDLLESRLEQARRQAAPREDSKPRILVRRQDVLASKDALAKWPWRREAGLRMSAETNAALLEALARLGVDHKPLAPPEPPPPSPRLERLEAVERWFHHDWQQIDKKLRTSIVEGISVFLGLFDQPAMARIFCPPQPKSDSDARRQEPADAPAGDGAEPAAVATLQTLPPLKSLIESGKVVCLNMPASANPALSRAVGVMLKQAWLQALLLRPSEMRRSPAKYFRPAVFLCDEYQAFATVGEADPCGDEKAFALSRQSRCVPIVATQSVSSLRSVTGSGEAWRTLLQTLRTKVFLSLSDDASARIASEMCGQIERLKASYSYNESTAKAGVSLLRSAGRRQIVPGRFQILSVAARASLSAQDIRRTRHRPGDRAALRRSAQPAAAALLSQAPLPAPRPRLLAAARAGAALMLSLDQVLASLPTALRQVFDDPSVTELTINSPDSVWCERGGRLYPVPAEGLTEKDIAAAALRIARPLGLDADQRAPIADARLEDGSRVAIAAPPVAPCYALSIRRFGGRAWTTGDLLKSGSLPPEVLRAAAEALAERRNILISGGTGAGKTTLLSALANLIGDDERIVVIEDTRELRFSAPNCLRLEARGANVTIRALVRHALRHRPDRLIIGEVRGGEAEDLIQALNTGHGGSLSTLHANSAGAALTRLATCALQSSSPLPWNVVCELVSLAVQLVIHLGRDDDGARAVRQVLRVHGYDQARGLFRCSALWPAEHAEAQADASDRPAATSAPGAQRCSRCGGELRPGVRGLPTALCKQCRRREQNRRAYARRKAKGS